MQFLLLLVSVVAVAVAVAAAVVVSHHHNDSRPSCMPSDGVAKTGTEAECN